MRTFWVILIGLHGIIHLLGFLKAFELHEVEQIAKPISKFHGSLWLLSFILFMTTAIFVLSGSKHYFIPGIASIILSQCLIFFYWSDAKPGTIINLILLLFFFLGFAGNAFTNKLKKERKSLIQQAHIFDQDKIDSEDISHLPNIVQTWLIFSGVVGQPKESLVYLEQDLRMKLKPDQENWITASASQIFSVDPPAFNWEMSAQINSLFHIVGRDKFEQGKGEMIIKANAAIPIASVANDYKIDQATLQRYLAEIIWFPSAALSSYIEWEEIDSISAKATMNFGGTTGSGVFHYHPTGEFKSFKTRRFKEQSDTDPIDWVVHASKTTEIDGRLIPSKCNASWQLEDGLWTWLEVRIKGIRIISDISDLQ